MRYVIATIWILLSLVAIVLTVVVAALLSNPTLVDPGQTKVQIEDYEAVAKAVEEASLRTTIGDLAKLGSRVTGYPGARKAADYIEAALEEIGLEQVSRDTFRVAVPIDQGAELRIEGREAPIQLHCVWPNLVRTPTTPMGGIGGPVIYAGQARPLDFNGKTVEGSLVLVDADCETDWLNAFLLGAQAVVFIEPEEPQRSQAEAKFLTVPANTPRYWIDREQGRALVEQAAGQAPVQATIEARMEWENVEAANLVASLAPAEGSEAEGVVVFSAYYDSMSVVPAASPGAEQACSIAALIELARTLKRFPLKRRAVFVAMAGHCQALAGMRDFVRRHMLPPEGEDDPALDVKVFVGLDLSSHARRVGLFYKGHLVDQGESRVQPWFSHLGKRWTEWATVYCEALGIEPAAAFVDGINSQQGRNWRTYLPTPMGFDAELALLAGHVGLTFCTTNDARLTIDSPLDTPERVDFDNLAAQVRLLCCVVPNFFNTAGPFIRKPPINYWTRLEARAVEFDFRKDYLPNEPLPGALIFVQEKAPKKSLCGIRGEAILMADHNGEAAFDGLPERRAVGSWRATISVGAFVLDPYNGSIIYAPDLGPEGAKNYPIQTEMNAPVKNNTIVCFRGRSLAIYDLADQRYYIPFDTITVLDAGSNSSPTSFGYLLPRNPPWMSATETCSVVFAKPGSRLRILMGAGPIGKRLLLLNASADKPLGVGFTVGEEGGSIPLTPLRAARDMWLLDEERIARFRAHGLENPRVNRLHERAAQQLETAEAALAERQYAAFLSHARAGWALEARIYPEVLGTANDVVKGLIFYLILVLPFAFFAERLLISAKTIQWRIAGTAGAFVAVFALLAVFHPAFRVSISPMMILLAFIILTLSALVLTLVVRRFEELMAERRAAASGVHAADVSRMSAAVTAFLLGIGNLRKRPIRTSLTAATIVLLSFSVLSLTAVVQYLKRTVVPYPGVVARYEGLLLRGRQWQQISDIALDSLRNEFGGPEHVVPRAWYYSAMVGERSFVAITGGPERRIIYATALLGATKAEQLVTRANEALVAGRWLSDARREAVLPTAMVGTLGMTPETAVGATIECFGRKLEVVGVVDEDKMRAITDLDGEPITPVDYVLMAARRREEGPADPDELEEYIHLTADSVAIVPYDFLTEVGGTLRSIVVRATDKTQVSKVLQALMPRTELTLFAGREGRTDLFSTRGASTITGAGSLLVPTLLAALIVFNTMLGSIYERTREIAIFSSVGLAPKHIGALFLAESVVYAVLGTVVGYILGQGVSLIIHSYGLLPGLQLNYSSLATVLLSIFIMAVVVGSSIWPAAQARRIAVPGLEARWQLPEAEGDLMAVELPFTVSRETAVGVNAYLEEYCQAHTEAALGGFATADVHLTAGGDPERPNLTLSMTAWLAPFDVGVSQRVELKTELLPDGIFYSITLYLTRLSGDQSSWRRLNRHFTDLIRRQFLIWRILAPDARDAYAERVRAAMRGDTATSDA